MGWAPTPPMGPLAHGAPHYRAGQGGKHRVQPAAPTAVTSYTKLAAAEPGGHCTHHAVSARGGRQPVQSEEVRAVAEKGMAGREREGVAHRQLSTSDKIREEMPVFQIRERK